MSDEDFPLDTCLLDVDGDWWAWEGEGFHLQTYNGAPVSSVSDRVTSLADLVEYGLFAGIPPADPVELARWLLT